MYIFVVLPLLWTVVLAWGLKQAILLRRRHHRRHPPPPHPQRLHTKNNNEEERRKQPRQNDLVKQHPNRQPTSFEANRSNGWPLERKILLGVVSGYLSTAIGVVLIGSPLNATVARGVFVAPLLTTEQCQSILTSLEVAASHNRQEELPEEVLPRSARKNPAVQPRSHPPAAEGRQLDDDDEAPRNARLVLDPQLGWYKLKASTTSYINDEDATPAPTTSTTNTLYLPYPLFSNTDTGSSNDNTTTTSTAVNLTQFLHARLAPVVERIYRMPVVVVDFLGQEQGIRTTQQQQQSSSRGLFLRINYENIWAVRDNPDKWQDASKTPTNRHQITIEPEQQQEQQQQRQQQRHGQFSDFPISCCPAEDPLGLLSSRLLQQDVLSLPYLQFRILLTELEHESSLEGGRQLQFWNRWTQQPFGGAGGGVDNDASTFPPGTVVLHSTHVCPYDQSQPRRRSGRPPSDSSSAGSRSTKGQQTTELVGYLSLENPRRSRRRRYKNNGKRRRRNHERSSIIGNAIFSPKEWYISWFSINWWAHWFQTAHHKIFTAATTSTRQEIRWNRRTAAPPKRGGSGNAHHGSQQQQLPLADIYRSLGRAMETLGDVVAKHSVFPLVVPHTKEASTAYLNALDHSFLLKNTEKRTCLAPGEGGMEAGTCLGNDHDDEDTMMDSRCRANPQDPVAWKPGDLHQMFERIVQNDKNVQVWSRPSLTKSRNEAGDEEDESDSRSTTNAKPGPWIITIDNFITREEAEHFIQWGYKNGYERSQGILEADLNDDDEDDDYDDDDELSRVGSVVISADRTSTNTWCQEGCHDDPIIVRVKDRIEQLTGVPTDNAELIQLLKYEEGQFYRTHHDYVDHERNAMEGPRILTVFLYLNDVDEGGETRFDWFDDENNNGNGAGLRIAPKVGRAVLWPSVLNENPLNKDHRTDHEAMPVTKGRKYGANVWIHLRSITLAVERGC